MFYKAIKENQKNNAILKMEKMMAFRVFEQRELINRYNNYSKFIVKEYLKEIKHDKFWTTMKTALVVHDSELDLKLSKLIQVAICDEFSDGVYLHKDKKIILCANTLIRRNDFKNAFYRHMIKLYDHSRSTNYSFKNCKHLACSEVRAASFSNKCNSPALTKGKFESKSYSQEKLDADKYCINTLANQYLKETPL